MSKGDWRRPQDINKESFDDNWKDAGLGLSPLERRLLEEETAEAEKAMEAYMDVAEKRAAQLMQDMQREVCFKDMYRAPPGLKCPCDKCK